MTLDEWAQSRGFTEEEVTRYGLYLRGDRVYIPYPNRHGVWYERWHTPGRDKHRYDQPHGSSPHLYNPLRLGPNTDVVWIAEGEFDTLSLAIYEVPAVGMPGATTWKRSWSHLFETATVVLALDPDEAGARAQAKLAGEFQDVAEFEVIYDDINDWLVEDPEGLRQAIDDLYEELGL